MLIGNALQLGNRNIVCHSHEHVLGHVPWQVLVRHLPEQLLRHVPENMLRHVPEHLLRHMLEHVLKHVPQNRLWLAGKQEISLILRKIS